MSRRFFRHGELPLVLLALLAERPKHGYEIMADLTRLFTDEKFRKAALPFITHPTNLEFWTKEFAAYPYRYRTEALAPVQNKLGAFLAHHEEAGYLVEIGQAGSPTTCRY